MTAEQYHSLVSTYDQRRIQEQIDRIPANINPTGKLYSKLLREIYENS